MPDYFNIPLPGHPALVETQNYLRSQLPDGTRYQDPATFHVTLVYVEDNREQDLSQFPFPTHIPRFGIIGGSLDTFLPDRPTSEAQEPKEYPVHLSLVPSAALRYLQADIFYKLQAMGVKLSKHSYPGAWRPHITLAYSPEYPSYVPLPDALSFEVNTVSLTGEGYTEQAHWDLTAEVAVQELLMETVWEFGKGFPEIPVDTVVLESIKEDDPNPFFTTLKIGKVGGYSQNRKRSFSRGEVEAIVRDVNTRKPEGRVGHHPMEVRAQSLPDFQWLGAVMEPDGTAWGKAYVYPHAADVRQFIKLKEKNRAKVGTSIFGKANEDEQTGEWVELEIQAIDLAGHADGISVQDLQTHPVITHEFIQTQGSDDMKTVEELTRDLDAMTKLVTSIRETLGNPADVVASVKELHTAAAQQKQIVALLGNPGDPVAVVRETVTKLTASETQVAELSKNLAEANNRLLDNDIAVLITEMVKLESLRPTVKMHVTMQRRIGEVRDADTAKAAITEYLELPSTKEIAEALVKKAAGGNVIAGAKGQREELTDAQLLAQGKALLGKS